MKDRTRLFITGVIALGALAVTMGGHGINFQFGDDQDPSGDRHHGEGARTIADLKDFNAVIATGPDDIVITHGDGFAVTAEGDTETLERLKFRVAEGTLHVERDSRKGWSMGRGDSAKILISLPALHRVTLTGPGDMRIDKLDGKDVEAKVTGPGDLTIDALAAETARFSLTGPGDISVVGSATSANLSATGSGNIRASKLTTQRAALKLIGSGDIAVHATQGAEISITGSGNARVRGTTACKVTTIGPGDADCRS